MKYIDSIEFGIVCNEDRQFSIWPAHLPLPSGYAFTGPTGSRTEMLALVEQQFVPTIPSTHLAPERQFRNSQSAD